MVGGIGAQPLLALHGGQAVATYSSHGTHSGASGQTASSSWFLTVIFHTVNMATHQVLTYHSHNPHLVIKNFH